MIVIDSCGTVHYYGAPFTKPTDKVCASPFYTAKDSTFLEMTGITNSSKNTIFI